jgi:hypothetical protein
MADLTFERGERRLVTLSVWLADGQTLPLTDPTWALMPSGWRGSVESDGTCDVGDGDGGKKNLTALVQPEKAGSYELEYTFNVGLEIIKRTVTIKVV